ncbi:unnamed protein product [Rhodiola kirilowii]
MVSKSIDSKFLGKLIQRATTFEFTPRSNSEVKTMKNPPEVSAIFHGRDSCDKTQRHGSHSPLMSQWLLEHAVTC